MKREQTPKAPTGPCPSCGKRESATLVGDWDHSYPCCSEACGRRYATSSARWQRELEEAREAEDKARGWTNTCVEALRRARDVERTRPVQRGRR